MGRQGVWKQGFHCISKSTGAWSYNLIQKLLCYYCNSPQHNTVRENVLELMTNLCTFWSPVPGLPHKRHKRLHEAPVSTRGPHAMHSDKVYLWIVSPQVVTCLKLYRICSLFLQLKPIGEPFSKIMLRSHLQVREKTRDLTGLKPSHAK